VTRSRCRLREFLLPWGVSSRQEALLVWTALLAGTQLRAHFGQEASIGGGYAVAVLGQETDNADPLVGEFVTAVKAPTKLITASESAALSLFTDQKVRETVKRRLAVLFGSVWSGLGFSPDMFECC
jgi:hypothetical protein